jgi:hypothetical protein
LDEDLGSAFSKRLDQDKRDFFFFVGSSDSDGEGPSLKPGLNVRFKIQDVPEKERDTAVLFHALVDEIPTDRRLLPLALISPRSLHEDDAGREDYTFLVRCPPDYFEPFVVGGDVQEVRPLAGCTFRMFLPTVTLRFYVMQNIDMVPDDDRLRVFLDSFEKICCFAEAIDAASAPKLRDELHTLFNTVSQIQKDAFADSTATREPSYLVQFGNVTDAIRGEIQALKREIQSQRWRYLREGWAWNAALPALAVVAALLWALVWLC